MNTPLISFSENIVKMDAQKLPKNNKMSACTAIHIFVESVLVVRLTSNDEINSICEIEVGEIILLGIKI